MDKKVLQHILLLLFAVIALLAPISSSESTPSISTSESTTIASSSSSESTPSISTSAPTTPVSTLSSVSTSSISTSTLVPPETTTQSSDLSDEEVLKQTNVVLGNITDTIQKFIDALSPPTTISSTTTTIATTTTITTTTQKQPEDEDSMRINLQALRQDNETFCVNENDTESPCMKLYKNIQDINTDIETIQTDVGSWKQNDLIELTTKSETLTKNVDVITDPQQGYMKEVNTDVAIKQMDNVQDQIKAAEDAVDDQINVIHNLETDQVVFMAVFGTFGGIIIVSLLVGLTFVVVKSKGSKKNSSAHDEEIASDPTHDNLAFQTDETHQPKTSTNPLARQPSTSSIPLQTIPLSDSYDRHPKPSSETPATKDIYSRPSYGTRPQTQDPYSKPVTEKRPESNDPYEPRNQREDRYSKPTTSQDNYYSRPMSSRDSESSAHGNYSRPAGGLPRAQSSTPQRGLRRYD